MNFRFEYDAQKSARNKDKHGIDFESAKVLWRGWIFEEDATTTSGEKRYAVIGMIGERHWTAIVTYRGDVRRMISVYPSKQRQIDVYEHSRKRSSA